MENREAIPATKAIGFLMTITPRLSALMMWSLFWLAHLTVAMLLLGLCWAYQVTANDVLQAFQRLRESRPGATLTALGLSGGTLAAGYAWLVRWLHRKASGEWLFEYLTRDM